MPRQCPGMDRPSAGSYPRRGLILSRPWAMLRQRAEMTNVRTFLGAIFEDWVGRMSGGGGLLLSVVGFYVPATWQRGLFVALGIVCLFYASYRAWLAEHRHGLSE